MTFINYLKGYRVTYTNSAIKDLESIDKRYNKTIREKLDLLTNGAHGLDVKRLAGKAKPTFRLRVGIYRITFEVNDHEIAILVVSVHHRQDAYK